MSAFMNNVGATAILLPAVISVAVQTKIPVSKLLIPHSFSCLLGGQNNPDWYTCQYPGNQHRRRKRLAYLKFFDFAPIGVVVLFTSVIYMIFIGRHLLPVRQTPGDAQAKEELRKFISEIRVLPNGKVVGCTLLESKLGAAYNLTVIAMVRGNKTSTKLARDARVHPDDILLIEGSTADLLRVRKELVLEIANIKKQHAELDKLSEKEISKNIVIVIGRPHEEIVRFAETERVDVVVMCMRGTFGIRRWLMGSVADRVARSVNVPVFLIRAHKYEYVNE